MIKYCNVEGYKNFGEVEPHIYLWVKIDTMKNTLENGNATFLAVNAYEEETLVFHGEIFHDDKQFKVLNFDKSILKEIKNILGKVKIVPLNEFKARKNWKERGGNK